jgi:ASC-1-like (ASCH) protein
MFDPTAFENMKVVLEGAVYDLDLTGDISIIDRNDYINTAKLSRKYELSFKAENSSSVSAGIILEAELENLAAELLPVSRLEQQAGCWIRLLFSFEHHDNIIDYEKIQKVVSDIWGIGRKIKQTVNFYPLQKEKMKSEVTIDFGRLVREDQIEDLTEMIDIMITTCEQIQALIPRR